MRTEKHRRLDEATIRIGHFEFLNGYPLYYGLEKGAGWGCFQLVNGVPTELNRLLLDGQLDISPVSSIEYAAHADELLLFPRISITADGAVDSIRLISRCPIEEIGSVAMTGQSATSVVLLKILLGQKYGIQPDYTVLADGAGAGDTRFVAGDGDGEEKKPGKKPSDAVLLIGDQALEAYYREDLGNSPPAGFNQVEPGDDEHAGGFISYDLGAEWKQFTGLPMVFALWAVRRPFFAARADETFEVQDRLQYSIDYCRGHWDEVVDAAARVYEFDATRLRSYFSKLRYDFTGEYRRGLAEFYRRAVDIGEAAAVPDLEFIGE